MQLLGMLAIAFGFVCILLGWYGAAHSPYQYEELPYVISGGLLGVALVIGGGVLVLCAWSLRGVEESRRNALAIVRSVDRLERMLREVSTERRGRRPAAGRGDVKRQRSALSTQRRRRVAFASRGLRSALLASACGSRLDRQSGRAGPGSRRSTGSGNGTTSDSDTGIGAPRPRRRSPVRTGTTVPGGHRPPRCRARGHDTHHGGRPAHRRRRSHRGPCGPDGNQTPAGGNGGATATGVTATTITVGNIASITGVAPGLTQSAQQATEAWAAYVNSQGGICGRQIKVTPYDDGNDSSPSYADTVQACSATFAMVGNASGFDDGSASAASACGLPIMAGRGLDRRRRELARHLRGQPRAGPLHGHRGRPCTWPRRTPPRSSTPP